MSRLSFDVYVPEMSTNVSSGFYRVYSNKDGGHCKWEDLLYTAIDDGYFPEVDLTFRLGTLPAPDELNSYMGYDTNTGLEMIVHNKYKAHGISGSAKQGGINLISISNDASGALRELDYEIYAIEEGKNPTEPRLSYISTGDGAKTMSVTLYFDSAKNMPRFHGNGMDEYIAINSAVNNDLSGTVMKVHRYDEKYDFWRQADHDSITLFYPFGK